MTITTHEEQEKRDIAYWRERTPEERLDAVEALRIEAGKVLGYEYPAPLKKTVAISTKVSCKPETGKS